MIIMENFIIGPMTPWGPFVTGFVGLFFAFVLYGLIMKYPAGKDSVVKIGDILNAHSSSLDLLKLQAITKIQLPNCLKPNILKNNPLGICLINITDE